MHWMGAVPVKPLAIVIANTKQMVFLVRLTAVIHLVSGWPVDDDETRKNNDETQRRRTKIMHTHTDKSVPIVGCCDDEWHI